MAKRVNKYRGYSVQDMISRTDIPITDSYIVSGSTYMDISNVSLTEVANYFGTPHTVYSVCTANNVNKWSAFGPWIMYITGSTGMNTSVLWRKPTNSDGYSLGSFAGYNNDAVQPSYYNSNRTETISTTASATVQFDCDFTLGEKKITGGDIVGTDIKGIVFSVWDGGTLKGYHLRDIESGKDEWRAGTSLGFSVSFTGPSSNYTDYTCKLHFNNSASTYSYNSSEECKMFDELPQYTKRVRVQTPSTDYLLSTPYVVTMPSSGWTLSTGHLSFLDMSLNHTYSTGLRVEAWVEQYNVVGDTWDRITSKTNIRDPDRNQPYSSGASIASSYNQHIWTTLAGAEATPPVPDWDHRLVIYFDGV